MTDQPTVLNANPLNSTGADRNQISVAAHQSIQRHGALLAFDPRDLHVAYAGGDTQRLMGSSAMALLGAAAENLFPPENLRRLQNLLKSGRSLARPVWVFEMAAGDKTTIDAIAHLIGGLLVLEFEPRHVPIVDDALALVQSMVRHVQQRTSLQALYEAIAREVQHVTDFDRVMVLRFAADGSGAVVADTRRPDMDSFLNLTFPSTHIPKQAQVLHLENWIRNIPDAHCPASPIIPSLDPQGDRPLDLSRSILRGASSDYRKLLAEIGIVASLSLSLVEGGQLWGLIVCHHRSPRYLPHRLRDVLELFAEMTSSHLEMKVIEAGLEAQLRSTRILEELVARMSLEPDLADGLIRDRPCLMDLIPADGVGLWVDGQFSGIGTTPDPAQVAELVNWLNATVEDGIFHTDCLSDLFPPARAFAKVASGLLALSVSKTPRDYVLWFRPEMSQTVSWHGDAAEPAKIRLEGAYLTPHSGFVAWQENVRLRSTAWLPAELEAAYRLRVALLEVVLTRIDRTSREREAARRQQEKMARELDLRLEQWQTTAEALRQETERRAVAETELSLVLRRTVADQEAERLRIAHELHDTLGQSLALLQLGLEGIDSTNPGSGEFPQRLSALKTLAKELGRDVNRLAWEIRPTALGDLPIRTAIKNFLENWSERSAIPIDLHLTLDDRRLPPDIETTLYRVLQEALTNVLSHAEATRVGVILGATDKLVTMIIDDDGRGFAADDRPAKRLGLLGARERLAAVSGSLEVESGPGRGTTLFIRIPL
jgi:two-component system, chemotaxis family, sensor kinase Cph1